MFERPGGGIVGCPPPVWGIDGTVDDVAGTTTAHLNVTLSLGANPNVQPPQPGAHFTAASERP
jgi:hypothetical protein